MLISKEYKEQMLQMHRDKAHFGKGGNRWAGLVWQLCMDLDTTSVLDYGCGKGELRLHLPWDVKCYDPGIPKHSASPDKADIVICTDVLEHIEPDLLQDVLRHIASLTHKVAILNINHQPAAKTLPDGRNAHLIQRPLDWWRVRLIAFTGWGEVACEQRFVQVVDEQGVKTPHPDGLVYDTTLVLRRNA